MSDQPKRTLYRRAFGYLRPYVKQELAILGLMIGTTLLALPQPIAVKLLIDEVLGGRKLSLLYVVIGVLLVTGAWQRLFTPLARLFVRKHWLV